MRPASPSPLYAWILFTMLASYGCSSDSGTGTGAHPETTRLVRTTRFGDVEGVLGGANTRAWLGIPYAKPPVGELRWKAPRDPDAWEGKRLSDSFADPCPQIGGLTGVPDPDIFGEPTGSEDCLYLNIWRPGSEDPSSEEVLPVYFWIHGGGNSVGYAGLSMYDGANFARTTNMVFVSINYRLGPLGWLTHPALRQGDALDASGNYGTLDILQALEWVQENISAFGGDPDNVTIAGESAGGINVYSMLASPLASGLFHRAVSESGFPMSTSMRAAEGQARRLIVRLLLNDQIVSTEEEAASYILARGESWTEDYLRSKTPEELLACCVPGPGGMLMDTLSNMIFIDGTVIPDDPMIRLSTGDYNQVPFLVGSNAEELKLFLPFLLLGKSEKELYELLRDFEPGDPGMRLEDLLSPLLQLIYEPVASLGTVVFEENGVTLPATRMRLHQDDVYAYQFAWDEEPPPMDFLIGAGHAVEIPFVFGNFQEDDVFGFAWSAANRSGREELSGAMMTYWGNFARTGDPNTSETDLPVWQPWSNEAGQPRRMLLDTSARHMF